MKNQKTAKTWTRSQSQTEGSLWEICLFAIFFVVIFSAVARAEAQTTGSSTSVNTQSATLASDLDDRRWKPSAKLLIETTQTLQEDEATSYGGWYQLTLAASKKSSGLGASLRLGYSREYSFEREDGTDGSLDNPSASISKKWSAGKDFRKNVLLDGVTLGVSGSLPGNREAERRTFMGSLGTSVRLTKAIRRLDLAQSLGYTRGFYEYDIRADGTVNSPNSFKATTELAYNVTEKLALSLSVAYTHAINYQGNGKGSEASAMSVDYSFNDTVSASVGVATERGTLQPDGETNRVKVFDPEVAQGFFDLVIGI